MDDATRWFNELFGGYEDPMLTVEVRAIEPETHDVSQEWFGLSRLDAAAGHAVSLAETHDVYAGVLPRRGRRGYAVDCLAARWLFCDVDGGEDGPQSAIELVKRAPVPAPDMAVISGGGLHCYWRVEEMDISRDRKGFTDLLKRLVRAIGGEAPGPHADKAATDCARVLRVPDTWNHKREPWRAVRLVRETDTPARTEEYWNGNLPLLPVISPSLAAAIIRNPCVIRKGLPHTYDRNPPQDDRELIERACRAKHGEQFAALYQGDLSAYGGDESRADVALLGKLAYWTGGDAARMERLMNQSALGARDKWRSRADYRRRTIERALQHGA